MATVFEHWKSSSSLGEDSSTVNFLVRGGLASSQLMQRCTFREGSNQIHTVVHTAVLPELSAL